MTVCQLLKSAGSPKALLTEILYHDSNLPPGAAEHLHEAEPEVRNQIAKILSEYKDVFPAELPK